MPFSPSPPLPGKQTPGTDFRCISDAITVETAAWQLLPGVLGLPCVSQVAVGEAESLSWWKGETQAQAAGQMVPGQSLPFWGGPGK